MHELRFVGPGDDSDHVRVESTDGLDQFSLLVDDTLREAIKPAPLRPNATSDSDGVSPREIQVRVRAGEDPNAIAEEAGIDVARVLLFARPVIAERSRVTDEARRARARRSTPDGQLVVFGESVDERFAAHGLDPLSVGWDSHRREDGQWLVTATWRGGDSDRSAQWAFTLAGRTVTPLDETAADLLSDRPIRPVVRAVPDLPTADGDTGPIPMDDSLLDQPPAPRDEVYDQDAVERSIADEAQTRATPPRNGGVPTAVTGGKPARSSSPKSFEHRTQSRSAARQTNGAPKLAMNSVAVREPTASREAAPSREAVPNGRAVPNRESAVANREAATARDAVAIHEQQTELFAEPLRLAEPLPRSAEPASVGDRDDAVIAIDESEEQKAARARIPSWDDILLGVRRKRD
ncbi:hypothetical protein SAMN05892883_0121 [Jatrophihabitans sp. GAS493]|uniref:septation protein SepH n=1 Tax=Jatrophihabitans sp. GAS493 TaxID=1907575 RepID=UPI000BB6C058|nr:septation protein SepH [Jatrophihabitans sp. GAS493]SOD70420.1 hypothetical protein SAMN05892883_0121 [Jatrophihabitans sp. GAS493]